MDFGVIKQVSKLSKKLECKCQSFSSASMFMTDLPAQSSDTISLLLPPWTDSIIALGAGELLVRTLHPLSSSPRKIFMIWPEVYRTFQPIPTSNVILIYSKLSVLIQFLISFLLHEAKSISKQTIKLSFLRLSPVFLRYLQSVNILLPLHQTLAPSI